MKGGANAVGIVWRAVAVLAALALLGYASVKMRRAPAARVDDPGTTVAAPAAAAPVAEPPRAEQPVVPAPPSPAAAPGQQGGFHFERTLVAVDVAADATQTVVDFPFENRGDKILTIKEVEKNCDCAEVVISNGKLSYAPGEGGIIRAQFRLANLVGLVDKAFLLFLVGDQPGRPSHTLLARINIPVIIETSAKTVDWSVGGTPTPQKVDVRVTYEQPIRLRNAVSSRDDLRVTLKTVEEGRHYELWLEPSNLTEPGLALVRVETDCAIPRWKLLQVFARFQAPGAGRPPSPKP